MCLAIAGKVVEIAGDMAIIDYDGLRKKAAWLLFPNLKVDDFVLVHAGFIIQVLDQDYGKELQQLNREAGMYGQ